MKIKTISLLAVIAVLGGVRKSEALVAPLLFRSDPTFEDFVFEAKRMDQARLEYIKANQNLAEKIEQAIKDRQSMAKSNDELTDAFRIMRGHDRNLAQVNTIAGPMLELSRREGVNPSVQELNLLIKKARECRRGYEEATLSAKKFESLLFGDKANWQTK